MHFEQEDGYRAVGLASATQTNPSFAQREHGDGIILPSNSIDEAVRVQQSVEEEKDALGIVSKDIN